MSQHRSQGASVSSRAGRVGSAAAAQQVSGLRRHSAFGDDDSDDDHAQSSRAPHKDREELLFYDRHGGAIKRDRSPPPPTGPRIIPMSANLDWRQDRKKRLGLEERARSLGSLHSMRVPGQLDNRASAKHSQAGSAGAERINDQEQKRGQQVRQRHADPASMEEDPSAADRDQTPPAEIARSETPEPETAEQAAIHALLAGEGVGSSSAQKLDLIIAQTNDKDLFRNDVDTRPEAPTLDDYAATPIDQFGAALLRGMGWKEGKGAGRNGKGPHTAPEPKKRAALLGLGATERPTDFTLASSGGKQSRPTRPDRRYVPVTRDATSSSSASREPSTREQRRDHASVDGKARRHDRSSSPQRQDFERRMGEDRRDRDDLHRSYREREERRGGGARESSSRNDPDRRDRPRSARESGRPGGRRYDDDRRRDHRDRDRDRDSRR